MKKKIVFLGAALAVLATLSSCSNEEVLTQVVDTPVDEGEPLIVKLVDTDGTTRGTDYTATTLPSFSLYSVKNGGTERWIGSYSDAGVSTGAIFTGNNGTFSNNDGIKWESGAWDFYALSDATFADEDDGNGGTQAAEHLNDASRHFTYTVGSDYNTQKDLLVAAVIGQESTTSTTVALPFQHALAQIGQITFNFDALASDNNMNVLVIKSITLHNINTTGIMTFPDTWSAAGGFTGTWSDQNTLGDYHIELPQFELDAAKNYKIFEETVDDDDPFENDITQFALNTKRGGIEGLQNYFRAPKAGATGSYVLPLAKKTGTEWDGDEGIYKAENATYTVDGGLYIIPQALPKTAWAVDGSGNVTGVTSGVYAEIQCIMFNETTDPVGGPYDDDENPFALDDNFVGAEAGNTPGTKMNNATMTQALNNPANYYSLLVPLAKTKKELKGGKRYNLTFDLTSAVSLTTGKPVFEGATITD